MLASRRQPTTHLPFHPHSHLQTSYNTSTSAANFVNPLAHTSPPSSSQQFDNASSSTSSPSLSDLDQSYYPPSPAYSSLGLADLGADSTDQYMSNSFDVPIKQQSKVGGGAGAAGAQGADGAWSYGQTNGQMLANPSIQAAALGGARNHGHHRAASGSSVGSSSPAASFANATTLMYAGQSPAMRNGDSTFDDSSRAYSNNLPTPTQTPTQDSFLAPAATSSYNSQFQGFDTAMAAHFAMKQAFADASSATEEDAPGFSHSTRHSVSSFGRNSPATPQTVNGEDFDDEAFKLPNNDLPSSRQGAQVPKLDRTLTDIYADELFNPTSAPPSSVPHKSARNMSLLSPYHNAMINERLQQANQARTNSPTASGSRAISPFRQSSPYAQPYGSPQNRASAAAAAAAQMRQKQRAEPQMNGLSHSNMPSHRQDGEPKTISPKDAVLDYQESEEDAKMPLFPVSSGVDFGPFAGGDFGSNLTTTAPGHGYGNLAVSNGANGWIHPTGQDAATSYSVNSSATPSHYNFTPSSVPGVFHGYPTNTLHQPNAVAPNEETPEFPAHLTSMESSMSEAPPHSSQNSTVAEPQRPLSTLADTGTYTCTYHGCVHRFETPQKLQRHKREAHRQNTTALTSASSSSSSPSLSQPLSTPGIGSGMTSAALAERNSQAGPHKCERINPTTGKPCSTIFSRPYDLTRHEDTIHNIKKQKVRCALCQEEKTFSRNDALTRHMRVVHPDVDFPGKHRRRGGRGDD